MRPMKLVLNGGPRDGDELFLEGESNLVFGRDEECGVQILDSKLSRAHFRLERKTEGVYLWDLDSTNGTFLNGKRVTEAFIIPNDVITVGSTRLTLHVEGEDPAMFRLDTMEDLNATETISHRFEHDSGALPDLVAGDDSIHSFEKLGEQLRALISISALLNSARGLPHLLQGVVEIATEILGGDRGCLVVVRKGKEERFFGLRQGHHRTSWKISNTVLSRALKEGLSTVSIDAGSDERFRSGQSVMVDEIKSVLCAPLESADQILGALYIDTVSHVRRYGQSDLELLSALGRQAGLAIQREMEKEEKELLFTDTIRAVIAAIEAKDRYLAGHSLRVSEYAEKLAYSLGYNSRFVDRLKYAAHLHDVGKIGTPESILNKPDRLTENEYEVIKEHPVIGADILENIRDIEDVVLAVRHHHERMDGKGYPDGLAGQNIPLMGRAIAVVDAFDAMTSDRAYRPAPGVEVAVSEFRRTAGTQFDPVFVEKMLELIESGQIKPPDTPR